MESSFQYGPANLFLTGAWVELPSDPEAAVFLLPLTHSEVSQVSELHYLNQQDSSYFQHRTPQLTLLAAIKDTRNILGFPSIHLLLNQLPPKDIKYLHDRLLGMSILTPEQTSELSDMLDIQFNSAFKDDTWGCQLCQEKKLDYSRGCGFLPEDKRDPAPMLPRVNGKRPLICPISTIDSYVLHQASRAYTMLDAGILPEAGGLGQQTEWFVKSALMYKNKIAMAEKRLYDERKN